MQILRKKKKEKGKENCFHYLDGLKDAGTDERDHEVNVMDEVEGLVDDGVGDVGQVIGQVKHHAKHYKIQDREVTTP